MVVCIALTIFGVGIDFHSSILLVIFFCNVFSNKDKYSLDKLVILYVLLIFSF